MYSKNCLINRKIIKVPIKKIDNGWGCDRIQSMDVRVSNQLSSQLNNSSQESGVIFLTSSQIRGGFLNKGGSMKKFKDLNFQQHPRLGLGFGTQAKLFFPNGYGVSVVTGSAAYTSKGAPYELAVLLGNEKENDLTYSTPITGDVLGHLTEKNVTAIMQDVQNLPTII